MHIGVKTHLHIASGEKTERSKYPLFSQFYSNIPFPLYFILLRLPRIGLGRGIIFFQIFVIFQNNAHIQRHMPSETVGVKLGIFSI